MDPEPGDRRDPADGPTTRLASRAPGDVSPVGRAEIQTAMYAIIESGSHQFRVREGDIITIDRRDGEPGNEVVFDKVFLLAGGEGTPTIGTPLVEGATVAGTLLRTYRQKKILIQKFKRRKGYRRKRGHRQTMTKVRITRVGGAA